MAQSLNTSVEYKTKAVSYLGMGGKVGHILLGDKALEFYNDKNVNDYIQIPWTAINHIGANVSKKKLAATLKFLRTKASFYLLLETLEKS
ncbi:putative cytoplasmic protein [Streptococcus pyogenes]|nr:putative cytoplasmic protein [Streptococcus pyogenes]